MGKACRGFNCFALRSTLVAAIVLIFNTLFCLGQYKDFFGEYQSARPAWEENPSAYHTLAMWNDTFTLEHFHWSEETGRWYVFSSITGKITTKRDTIKLIHADSEIAVFVSTIDTLHINLIRWNQPFPIDTSGGRNNYVKDVEFYPDMKEKWNLHHISENSNTWLPYKYWVTTFYDLDIPREGNAIQGFARFNYGVPHGKYRIYSVTTPSSYINGCTPIVKGRYKMGHKIGVWKFYDSKGEKLIRKERYKRGVLVKSRLHTH